MSQVFAGTGRKEITPVNSQFLFGYPHVERFSNGVHDPLYSTALCLESGEEKLLFISNDIIFVSKPSAERIRKTLAESLKIPEKNIMVTATHTHSGPITMDYLSNQNDPVVPRADREYVRFMEEQIILAGIEAGRTRKEVEVGLVVADGTGVGTNRRDPSGPSDRDVPVLAVRTREDKKMLALMLVCSMHPTVLHEDSKLVSSDFPGMTRKYLNRLYGQDCAVIYHTGCEGNQSPRHVTRGNTFEEAERLGYLLGAAVEKVLSGIRYRQEVELRSFRSFTELPGRVFPDVSASETSLKKSIQKLQYLRDSGASSRDIRTAECDWFGAEETLTLSVAQASGLTEEARRTCLPAEIQVFKIGDWVFVGWPGELFIEFGLAVRESFRDTFVINLANGELQGYIVTREAAEEGGYEASNSLFSHEAGDVFVRETKKLLVQAGVKTR